MLAYTAKSVVKSIQSNARGRRYVLTFEKETDKSQFIFDIDKDGIILTQIENSMELCQFIEDLDMVYLPEGLVALSLIEYSPHGEMHSQLVKFEAQLFVIVFRLMKDKVHLLIEKNGKIFECEYIDRRVFIKEINDDSVVLRSTNLYKLHKVEGDYNIRVFSQISVSISPDSYANDTKELAHSLGKEFILREEVQC